MTTRHHHGQGLNSRRTRVSFTLLAIYAGSRGGYRAEKPEYFRDLRGGIERRMLAFAGDRVTTFFRQTFSTIRGYQALRSRRNFLFRSRLTPSVSVNCSAFLELLVV